MTMVSNNRRTFTLPETYSRSISSELEARGFSIHKPAKIAEAVTRLSTMYVEKPEAATPWHETWAQAASLAYFFPLNFARNKSVALEAERLGFFKGLNKYYDFGSGTGSALFAFLDVLKSTPQLEAYAQDIDQDSLRLAQRLKSEDTPQYQLLQSQTWPTTTQGTFLSASYVLTELPELPREWLKFEALAIVEPSTRLDGRKLMNHRKTLIENGYHIWAPCTHQDACPMLVNSDRDWCHDRIHWNPPTWLAAIEKHLPMKNRTLTFSYLLARRDQPAPEAVQQLARLTGDMLVEKGKTRQSICRGPEREFLSWFPQRLSKGEAIDLQRGSLVRLSGELEKKATEVRVSSASSVEEIPPQKPF